MSSKPVFRILTALSALFAALLMSLPAIAAPVTLFVADDFYIPRPVANSDQAGVERLLIDFDLAANGFADLIGQECSFTVAAFNGDSVHENNYGVIRTNGQETIVSGTESQPNVETTRLSDSTLVLGPTIQLYNVMLPTATDIIGTSVDYTVTVDCDITTTTTTEPTTTTTTEPTTTTTTEPTTTTTTAPTTTSSVLGTTTTTAQQVDSTTSTTVPSVSESTLPFTGAPVEAAGVAMAAVALLMLGSGALMAARER